MRDDYAKCAYCGSHCEATALYCSTTCAQQATFEQEQWDAEDYDDERGLADNLVGDPTEPREYKED